MSLSRSSAHHLLRLCASLALALLLCGQAAEAQGRRSHATAHTVAVSPLWPGNPFSATSIWNSPLVADAPVASDSKALVNNLIGQVIDTHGGWIDTWDYSDPVYVVGHGQADVHVTLDDENPSLQQAFDAVPVPADATAALGDDEQMTVWQPSTNRLWDFWHMQRESDGWHARWGGEMQDVSHNPGYFQNSGLDLNWGATATGLPLLGGLITFADLRRGYINHAVALALPQTQARDWVWPAQRTDGATYGSAAIAEGTRFRLDPRLDLSHLELSPLGLMIARAAQRYGIIVRDKGGAVTFFGQAPVGRDDPWTQELDGKYPNQALDGFPWTHLEVIRSTTGCCWSPH
jgi:hypothetical protein